MHRPNKLLNIDQKFGVLLKVGLKSFEKVWNFIEIFMYMKPVYIHKNCNMCSSNQAKSVLLRAYKDNLEQSPIKLIYNFVIILYPWLKQCYSLAASETN